MARYGIRHNVNGLWVHALAPLTQPSSTEDFRQAKAWSNKRSAQDNIERYGLTNVSVVPIPKAHSIDVFISGGGSDGPKRYYAACLDCSWSYSRVLSNYDEALTIAGEHRVNPTAPYLWLAEVNTGTFNFLTVGTSQGEVESALLRAWEAHADTTGADPEMMLDLLQGGEVNIYPTTFGRVLRDGDPITLEA
jgi:hypothetical protein